MTPRRPALTLARAAGAACSPLTAQARANPTTIDALEGCFDFAFSNTQARLPKDRALRVSCNTRSFAAWVAPALPARPAGPGCHERPGQAPAWP